MSAICKKHATPMKALFTSTYCPRCDEKEEETPILEYQKGDILAYGGTIIIGNGLPGYNGPVTITGGAASVHSPGGSIYSPGANGASSVGSINGGGGGGGSISISGSGGLTGPLNLPGSTNFQLQSIKNRLVNQIRFYSANTSTKVKNWDRVPNIEVAFFPNVNGEHPWGFSINKNCINLIEMYLMDRNTYPKISLAMDPIVAFCEAERITIVEAHSLIEGFDSLGAGTLSYGQFSSEYYDAGVYLKSYR